MVCSEATEIAKTSLMKNPEKANVRSIGHLAKIRFRILQFLSVLPVPQFSRGTGLVLIWHCGKNLIVVGSDFLGKL